MQLLAKDPEQRPSSAGEVVQRIQAIERTLGVQPKVPVAQAAKTACARAEAPDRTGCWSGPVAEARRGAHPWPRGR